MQDSDARLLHIFSSFSPGGAELRAIEVMAGLPRGWRHRVLSLDGSAGAAAHLPPGVAVELVPAPPRAGSPATVARLHRLLAGEAPDLLLTYGWGAFDGVLAGVARRHRRLVHHEDGFNADEARRFKRRRVLARRWALGRARAVVVPSRRLERIALDLWRLPPSRVRRIPNGVAVERFAPADGNPELRRALGLPEGAPVAGAVTPLRAEKNLARLLRACAATPPELGLHLLIVGDGPERRALEEEAARLGLAARVRFAGHQVDVAPWYRALDLLAVSSDTEQQPRGVLEAMASALPVVATEVGDVAEMLPPEQGQWLVALGGDEETVVGELAARIAALAADGAARRELGALNRLRAAECHGRAGMVRAYVELYWEVFAG